MKFWKIVPVLLLCVLCGNVSGDGWSLAPKKTAPQPKQVAAVRTEDPTPPAPQPTPVPPVVRPPYVNLPPTLTVKAGAWLAIEAETNCGKVLFDSPDDNLNLFPDGQLVDPLKTVVSAIVPGQYRIKAIAAMADVPCMSSWCIITVTGPQPPPGPAPQPGPTPAPPAPVVTATNLWIVTIDDVTARQPATTAILTDPVWRSLVAPKFKYSQLDLNSTNGGTAVKTKYAAILKLNGGQPAIGIFNADTGAWLNQNADDTKLPATVDGLRQLLKKYGGQL